MSNHFENSPHERHNPDQVLEIPAHVRQVELLDFATAAANHDQLAGFLQHARNALKAKPGMEKRPEERLQEEILSGSYDAAAYHAVVVDHFSLNPTYEFEESRKAYEHHQQPRPSYGEKANVVYLDDKWGIPRTMEPLALLTRPNVDVYAAYRKEDIPRDQATDKLVRDRREAEEMRTWEIESDALAIALATEGYNIRETDKIAHTPAAHADAFIWNSPPQVPENGASFEWRKEKVAMVAGWLKEGGKGAITCRPENLPYIQAAIYTLDPRQFDVTLARSTIGDASSPFAPKPHNFDKVTCIIERRKIAEATTKAQSLEDIPFVEPRRNDQPMLLGVSAARHGIRGYGQLVDRLRDSNPGWKERHSQRQDAVTAAA